MSYPKMSSLCGIDTTGRFLSSSTEFVYADRSAVELSCVVTTWPIKAKSPTPRFLPAFKEMVSSPQYSSGGMSSNGKPLIAVAAHKEHYGIYPFSPEVIEEAKQLLADLETAKGTIRFKYDQFPSNELLKEIVRLRTMEINKYD